MDYKELMEKIKSENGEIPRPLELLGQLDEGQVIRFVSERQAAMGGTTIPPKYKALIAMATGIALDSPPCILNHVKQAKKAGAGTEEIVEALIIVKFAKSATAMASSIPALEWLVNNK
jgi:AhpD family alkylhydroperoxidase